MDQDPIKSENVFDPINCHYKFLVPAEQLELELENDVINGDVEDGVVDESPNTHSITVWSNTETLALINIFSLFKEKFKLFKKRKDQWKFISEELVKIGIHKVPEKCEIKWKNLLRAYRQHKSGTKDQKKFEFFNELDHIVANDNKYKYVIQYNNAVNAKHCSNTAVNRSRIDHQYSKKVKCRCLKSEKQRRHEDRMAIMTKKVEIEERKVRAFEDYVQFLKSNFKSK